MTPIIIIAVIVLIILSVKLYFILKMTPEQEKELAEYYRSRYNLDK